MTETHQREGGSIGPTPDLAQHHDLSPPNHHAPKGQPWVIRTRVDALHHARHISDADVVSCRRWRRDWDVGIEGVSAGGLHVRVDGDEGRCALDNRVDALSRWRASKDALGEAATLLLEMCLVMDASWVAIGARANVSKDRAKAYTIQAIQLLTSFYQKNDQGTKNRLTTSQEGG